MLSSRRYLQLIHLIVVFILVINPIIECEHCVEELKSDRPKEYLADYLDMIKQDRSGTKSQSEKSKVEDVKSLDEITCHMQATIEEHEDKLRKLEQRLKELSAGYFFSSLNKILRLNP